MNDKQRLQVLMSKVEKMQKAQVMYLKSKGPVNLKIMTGSIKDLEDFMVQLKREGYTPEENNSTQNSMFK